MNESLVRVLVYLFSFFVSAYAVYGIDFAKLTRKGQSARIQILFILLTMALAYGVAQFIIGISQFTL